MAADPLLSVRDLRVHFGTDDGMVKSVDGLTFEVAESEIVGIVGESGSGKSVASKAILGLHRGSSATVTGEISYRGRDLVTMPSEELRALRGSEIAMIFQDPMSSLHPFFTVGRQISEAYRVHHSVSRKAARTHVVDLLDRVGIPGAKKRFDAYPHQFSGGMRQRVMIAMALTCDPSLLVADEPTTALDVTVQAQILELLRGLRTEFGSAVILITHDLGVVAETCDRVVVMYAGQCVEQAPVAELFDGPQMPYTWGLLSSMPRIDETRARLDPIRGQPPSLIDLPVGCAFAPRCDFRDLATAQDCAAERPMLELNGAAHASRCHIDLEKRMNTWHTQIAPTL